MMFSPLRALPRESLDVEVGEVERRLEAECELGEVFADDESLLEGVAREADFL